MQKIKNLFRKKLLLIIPLLLLLVISISLMGYFTSQYYAQSYAQSYNYSEPTSLEPVDNLEDEEISFTEVPGITNVLILSTDARPGDKHSRSDSIILATMDNVNKKLKVTSLLRDMLVDIKSHGEEKLNHAFAYGEAPKTMETIQNNFGIKIDNYIVVDFNGFKKIIDGIGGVELTLKDSEIKQINNYTLSCGGKEDDLLTTAGTYNLNGTQALTYARIRKVGNGEYERTERQRKIIQAAANKLRDSSPLTLITLINDFLPYIKTNISLPSAINYAFTALKIGNSSSFDIEQFRLPLDSVSRSARFESKGWVLVIDKAENSKALQEFIFNDNRSYKPNKGNMNNILNRCYIKYGEVEDESKEVSKTTSVIDESLSDYNKELDIEDFSDDNWSENLE